MRRILLFFALALAECGTLTALPACGHAPAPHPTYTCANACDRLTALGCAEAKPTPKGVTCVEVCQNAASVFELDLRCMSEATSCDAGRKCGR